jgi:archaellum component FlaC
MNQEDVKNLVGWLQAIYKETQEARGATNEMRKNIHMIPEIREFANKGSHDSGDAERKIEETRNHLEARINKLEDVLNDIKGDVREIRNKVDHLK